MAAEAAVQQDPSAGLQAVGDESSGQPAIVRCGVAFLGDPQPETGLGNGPVERGGAPGRRWTTAVIPVCSANSAQVWGMWSPPAA